MQKKSIWCSIQLMLTLLGTPLLAQKTVLLDEQKVKMEKLTYLRVEGLRALDTENYRKAEEFFHQAIELGIEEWLEEKEVNELCLNLARVEVHTKQYRKAQERLNRLYESSMSEAMQYHRQILLAHIQKGQGQTITAMRLLNNLKNLKPLKTWELSDQKFYLKIKGQVDRYFEDLFTQAERCYEGALYSETIPLYQEILRGITEDLYQQSSDSKLLYQVRLRLANSAFQLAHYQDTKEILLETKRQFPVYFDPDSFLQLIVSCQKLQLYAEAHALCQEFFTYKFSPKKQEAVRLQMGRLYQEQKEYAQAKSIFKDIIQNSRNEQHKTCCRFELAKIFIKEKDYCQVEEVLHPDYFRFSNDDATRYEWAYLRAEALFLRQEYEIAASNYQEALQGQVQKEPWFAQAQFGQGSCYHKLAEHPECHNHARKRYLKKAEECFEELSKTNVTDQTMLALARTYFLQHRYFQDSTALTKMHQLLKVYPFKKVEAQLETGLILADMTPSVTKKRQIYQTLSHPDYQSAQNYGKVGYFHGLLVLQKYQQESLAEDLDEAIDLFKSSLMDLNHSNGLWATQALKNMAACYLHFSNFDKLFEGYETLQSLLLAKEHDKPPFRSELYGCLAEICLKLMSFDAQTYLQNGLMATEEMMQVKLSSDLASKANFLRGRLLFQGGRYDEAEEQFNALLQKDPDSPYAQDSFFWLAETLDFQSKDYEKAQKYRRRVYENYPDSPLAAEAYFLTFNTADYLEGNKEAIEHLNQLNDYFPNSPYVIASSYLQGLYHKQSCSHNLPQYLSQAIEELTLTISTYETCYKNQSIAKGNLPYFTSIYFRAWLALSQCYFEKACKTSTATREVYFEKAIEGFNIVFDDFQNSEPKYAHLLKSSEVYPKVYEEAQFGRALALAKSGDIDSAHEAFKDMIEYYHQLNVYEGEYLSKAWYERAMIAVAAKEHQDALEFFHFAEKSLPVSAPSADYKIDLKIQESLCYRELGQLDMAMLKLSSVIHEGGISNLCVKAMVIRAEIYELQGRKDMAQKQLGTAAKQGGEWARVAQEKLVKEYGYS